MTAKKTARKQPAKRTPKPKPTPAAPQTPADDAGRWEPREPERGPRLG